MSAALSFHNLTLGYDRHPAVHHLDGAVETGALLAVVGPNGAGKSTLAKGIMGALTPLDGRIERAVADPRAIAYLPQIAEIDRTFPIDVFDVAAMGLWGHRGIFGGFGRADTARIQAAIAAVGLAGFERRGIATLSGGQMQRALFARLMLQDAQTLLLDEPFTAVDERTTSDLLGLIAGWHKQGRTIIAILHDFELVRRHFPQSLLLAREPVAWGDTAAVLTPDNLARATRMCEAFERDAHDCARAA
jgi:zinc/manganese transport system ATP-binding protein